MQVIHTRWFLSRNACGAYRRGRGYSWYLDTLDLHGVVSRQGMRSASQLSALSPPFLEIVLTHFIIQNLKLVARPFPLPWGVIPSEIEAFYEFDNEFPYSVGTFILLLRAGATWVRREFYLIFGFDDPPKKSASPLPVPPLFPGSTLLLWSLDAHYWIWGEATV